MAVGSALVALLSLLLTWLSWQTAEAALHVESRQVAYSTFLSQSYTFRGDACKGNADSATCTFKPEPEGAPDLRDDFIAVRLAGSEDVTASVRGCMQQWSALVRPGDAADSKATNDDACDSPPRTRIDLTKQLDALTSVMADDID